MNPKVSINLPVYNGGRSLRRLLDSILAQTLDDYQVIITDNASTDDTEQICREYAEKDSRFHYHRNHKNLGLQFSYRRGLMNSFNCQYMVYVSHGDYWDPRYLELCARALDQEPRAVVAYSHCTFFDGSDGRPVQLYKDDFVIGPDMSPADRYTTVLARLGMCTAYYGLIRLTTYAEIEWVQTQGFAALDNGVLAALALKGSFVQIDLPLFFREAPTYGGETMDERYERINKMAGGEVALKTSILSAPFRTHIFSHCGLILHFVADPADRDYLIGQTKRILMERYGRFVQDELERSLRLLSEGRFEAGYAEGGDQAPPGRHRFLENHYHLLVNVMLNTVSNLLPTMPGLYYGRALTEVLLGRADEALPLLHKELAVNPTHRPSLELRAKLRQAGLDDQGGAA